LIRFPNGECCQIRVIEVFQSPPLFHETYFSRDSSFSTFGHKSRSGVDRDIQKWDVMRAFYLWNEPKKLCLSPETESELFTEQGFLVILSKRL
jgi:hypothetical protein